jgi:2-alkyl-3-oxoalkanoate reductase
VFETIARAAELPPPRLSLPYPAAMAAAKSLAAAFSLAGRKETPPLTPFVVKLLSRDVVYDASKAVRELGWSPRMRSLEGITRFASELAGKAQAYTQPPRAASPGAPVE